MPGQLAVKVSLYPSASLSIGIMIIVIVAVLCHCIGFYWVFLLTGPASKSCVENGKILSKQ